MVKRSKQHSEYNSDRVEGDSLPENIDQLVPEILDIEDDLLYYRLDLEDYFKRIVFHLRTLNLDGIREAEKRVLEVSLQDEYRRSSESGQEDTPEEVAPEARGIPRWADRNDDNKISCIDFIKKHYGQGEGDDWERGDLTRASLRQADRQLYQAYYSWIGRKKFDPLDLPKVEPPKFSSPEEKLEHKREIERAAEKAYRDRQRALRK